MAYILLVNPFMLGEEAGMDFGAVFVATAVASAIGTLLMGLLANYPIALAPGMGLNAYFTYTVVQGMGVPWQTALGVVFISGCVFLVLTFAGVRQLIVNAIPKSLFAAIAAGIVTANKDTMVSVGDLHKTPALLAICGFLLIVALDRLRVKGAILIGIVAVTVLSFFFAGNTFHGIFSAPPSLAPTFGKLDISGAFGTGILNVVLVFFLVELFDATGTLMGVAARAGLLVEGKMQRLNKALMADSTAIVVGSVMGTSSTTAYVESAAGVQAGGRTGLTAVVVALLFLASLFISPLAGVVPAYATAPALLFVSCLMLRDLADVDWNESTESIPAAVTALLIPFTYSIAHGIAFGFITYAALKLLTGRVREVKAVVWIIALVFLFKYTWIGA
jgi:AGZA family xanthine/uracil permease-like MFS transporter